MCVWLCVCVCVPALVQMAASGTCMYICMYPSAIDVRPEGKRISTPHGADSINCITWNPVSRKHFPPIIGGFRKGVEGLRDGCTLESLLA